MGVDFFPCDYCGESICDCGSYERCECGRRWCDRKCAEKDGYMSDSDGYGDEPDGLISGPSCKFCRLEDAEDSKLLRYLLCRYNLTREQVVKDYVASLPPEEADDDREADDHPDDA